MKVFAKPDALSSESQSPVSEWMVPPLQDSGPTVWWKEGVLTLGSVYSPKAQSCTAFLLFTRAHKTG